MSPCYGSGGMIRSGANFVVWLMVGASLGAGCSSSPRVFDEPSDGGTDAGGSVAASGSGTDVAGKNASQGGSSAGESNSSAGSAQGGDAGSGPAEDEGGAPGSAGSGGTNSTGGTGPQECPPFSCCISGKVFDADALSPLNACDQCKPGVSTTAFTPADGRVCGSEQAFVVRPKVATYTKETCGTFCNTTPQTLTASVSLSLKVTGGQNPTSSEAFLLLDFANLLPSDHLTVTKAVLKLYASPDAPTQEQRYLTVKRSGSADNLCKIVMPTSAGSSAFECDVTSAVTSWLASPAASARSLKVSMSTSTADRTLSVLTPLTADGTQRPVLSLDYSAQCAGNQCPPLQE